MTQHWQQIPAGPDGGEAFYRAGAASPDQVAELLVRAAHLARSGSVQAQIAREVAAGAAGQQAGPRGLGPEPALQHAPGGQLLEGVQHPAFTTVEYLFRTLPTDSWTSSTRTPQNPLRFELGAFTVPEGQIFLVMDYQFMVLRQSGADPFDFMAAAPYRFSGFMGFDIALSGRRTGNLFYQLDPAPTQFQQQSFAPPISAGAGRPGSAQFNTAAANSYGNVAGAGSALLPVRPEVQGPRNQPFTMVAQAGDKVSLVCVIFRRITAPLAGIQGSLAGYQIHQNTMSSLLERMRPR